MCVCVCVCVFLHSSDCLGFLKCLIKQGVTHWNMAAWQRRGMIERERERKTNRERVREREREGKIEREAWRGSNSCNGAQRQGKREEKKER